MMADQAIEYVLARYAFNSVLDVGAGQGLHAKRFREAGKFVTTIDSSSHWAAPDILMPIMELETEDQFDLIWCSHVLEHQLNPNLFLKKIFSLLKPGGIYAITIPPMRPKLVGGHVNTWNAGILTYNLVMANYDCRDAAVKEYDYNISIIGRKRYATHPPLHMDRGDIEKLAPFFPFPATQGMPGAIGEANWSLEPDPRPIAGASYPASLMSVDMMRKSTPMASELENLSWACTCISIPGIIAEFGVYRGKSLKVLAETSGLPTFGFDSFVGLPEEWVRSDDSTYKAGHFKLSGLPTGMPENVKMIKGFFSETVKLWKSTNSAPLSLIHIDSDLYSSAKEVLVTMNDRIHPGTVVVFDEICDWAESGIYPKWPEGEWKALIEWMTEFKRELRFISRGPNFSAAFVVSV